MVLHGKQGSALQDKATICLSHNFTPNSAEVTKNMLTHTIAADASQQSASTWMVDNNETSINQLCCPQTHVYQQWGRKPTRQTQKQDLKIGGQASSGASAACPYTRNTKWIDPQTWGQGGLDPSGRVAATSPSPDFPLRALRNHSSGLERWGLGQITAGNVPKCRERGTDRQKGWRRGGQRHDSSFSTRLPQGCSISFLLQP